MSNITELAAKAANRDLPEIFNKGTFVPVEQIIGKDAKLVDYLIYESNKDIYKDDNKKGVVLLCNIESVEFRVSTHAKAIVRDMVLIKESGTDPRGTDFKIVYKDYKGKKILVFA